MKNIALLIAVVVACGNADAAPKPIGIGNPDFTAGAPAPDAKQHDWTLGPTGLRGWMFSQKMETSEARQIYVTRVDANSPADGLLSVGDIILGTDGRPFTNDARIAFGKAITAAESRDGKLSLLRWRAGKQDVVAVKLAVLGDYVATAPYDCPKSAKIFERGCAAIAAKLKTTESRKRGNPIERSLNALALLASGKPEYMPLVSEEAKWAASYSESINGRPSWWYGYVAMFLGEYQLATNDPETFEGLKRIALEIAHGQSAVGTWGHTFAEDSGRLSGYGAMNQPGLSLTIGMILAKKAGVKDPALDAAILKSTRFLAFYIGKGCIPYGDHAPWMENHDDNGKCGSGAVMFDLLGYAPGAEFFSRMCTASYGTERDTGHTGNFFNLLWAMPGVARSGPNATGAWMRESSWYFDLARRWDGTFVYQGEPMDVEDNKYKGWDSTGAYLLAYAMPLKMTFVTGKKPSVAPQLSATAAHAVIEDGRGWSPGKKAYGYETRSVDQLLAGLTNWSPIVRDRSANALAKREGDFTPQLLNLLGGGDAFGRHGACVAFSALGKRASAAAPALKQMLWDNDLWLRMEASIALANIGDAGKSTAPDLLKLLITKNTNDPRGMVQRYVTLSLFYPGGAFHVRGMLAKSLDGIDRRLLYPAVEMALQNEDGFSRDAVGTVYERLTLEELRPLLPAIYKAIVEPAPSGEMFADGIRIRGIALLAKHHIAEGIPLCTKLIEPERWGEGRRINELLKILTSYGAAAKSQLPQLRELETTLSKRRNKDEDTIANVRKAIEKIESAKTGEPLRSLKEFVKP